MDDLAVLNLIAALLSSGRNAAIIGVLWLCFLAGYYTPLLRRR